MKQGMLRTVVLVSLSLSLPALAQVQAPRVTAPTLCDKNPALCRNVTIKPTCPDPAAQVDFRVVRRDNRFAGLVEIKASVKNLGLPYVTSPNQQALYLYELVPGAAPRLVATQRFANLASGEVASVGFTRTWNSSSPAEGEFPPSYRAVISYDPDIAIDGNPKNDDCRPANNAFERSGTEINALLR